MTWKPKAPLMTEAEVQEALHLWDKKGCSKEVDEHGSIRYDCRKVR